MGVRGDGRRAGPHEGVGAEGAAFTVAFFALLVGIKLVLAALLAASRERLLGSHGLALALRASGVPLPASGAPLAADGVSRLS